MEWKNGREITIIEQNKQGCNGQLCMYVCIIVLTKNGLFKFSDAIYAGIFIECSPKTIRLRFVQANLPGKTCQKIIMEWKNGREITIIEQNLLKTEQKAEKEKTKNYLKR